MKKRYFTLVMKVSFKSFFYVFLLLFFLFMTETVKRRRDQNHYSSLDSNIKLGWTEDFDKFIINYVFNVFMFDTFCSSSKLINTFTGHIKIVYSIDYPIFDECQFICFGSTYNTVRVCDVDNNKQIQSFNGHSFRQLQIFNKHTSVVNGIEFHYLTVVDICVLGLLTIQFVYGMLKHQNHYMFSMDMKVVNNNKNDNKMNNISVIAGNGYTICSGSFDKTIRILILKQPIQCIRKPQKLDY
ncbi:hypothetical protein RFI_05771 [Reticulomyxa filosa]|uniref:Uncharacterized protein n=1 Tax=Reticulomyxa filosa TaxID=46433 RepID=X6NYF4_RETFI|nr:hypothetical protein RFI_05771 [Reticulomyxa filosa]|eukprot:ETO31350.1 hypothetical protein RFI_05771 [Reticulomyxa filosa]